ncbi:MAG: hypothetical protein ACFCVF_08390 [Kineosporiaceae bacterium]
MPALSRLVRAAIALAGPVVVEAVARAARDPQRRRQVLDILVAARATAGQVTPAARSRTRLRQDLDATVALARSRWESARDETERALALEWLREAQDVRRAADIVDNLTGTERRALTERLDARRLALLRRMLATTLEAVDEPPGPDPGDRSALPSTPRPGPDDT